MKQMITFFSLLALVVTLTMATTTTVSSASFDDCKLKCKTADTTCTGCGMTTGGKRVTNEY